MPRWRRVAAYDNPDAYMRRVMVSLRTSWWRRHRGREVRMAMPPELGPPDQRDLADDQAQLDLVLGALRTLPPRQQVAVVRRHYCDLSEAEVAAVMGISVGGVKSQTSKGLTALRTALAPQTSEEATR